jgi:hypothetical protein
MAAAGLVACGGGGPSKADFVAKADAACGAGNGALSAIASPTNLPELAAAADAVATTVEEQAGALGALNAPGHDKGVVAGVVTALAEVAAPARTLQDAAGGTDDGATARATNDLRAKADAAAVRATSYGMAVCGKAPVTNVFDGARTVLKAAFVARAESLCVAANGKAEALAEPTSLASAARFLAAYVPIEEKLFADVRALTVPPGDESTVADMLDAQDKVIARDKERLAAAQARNQAAWDRAEEAEAPLVVAANAKFDAYGLRNCGTLSAF